jgi:hypothetical protein
MRRFYTVQIAEDPESCVRDRRPKPSHLHLQKIDMQLICSVLFLYENDSGTLFCTCYVQIDTECDLHEIFLISHALF